jgi:hypothetical protein
MIQAWSMHSLGSGARCRFKEYQYLGLILMVNFLGQEHITASSLQVEWATPHVDCSGRIFEEKGVKTHCREQSLIRTRSHVQ